jgi:hypothetical protein
MANVPHLTFVLTLRPRPSTEMEGGTALHFM